MRYTLIIAAVAIATFSACSNQEAPKTEAPAQSKQERNKKIIMECVDNINKHDADMALKEIAPDFVDYSDGSMPPQKGDSAKMVLKVYMAAFPDMKNQNAIFCADGDYVMVYSDVTGTWTGDMMGMKATGRSMHVKDVDVFKLNEEGKITEHHNVQNVPCVMASLGAVLPKAPEATK